MRALRNKETLTLEFNFLENSLLRRALTEISRNYKIKPEALDPEIAKWWYSTRGCKSARMTEEETREWVASLHAAKSAHLAQIEQWKKALGPRNQGPYRLGLTLEEGQTLMMVLNDHRLLTAGRYAIGEEEIDCRAKDEIKWLSREQQKALRSIRFLEQIIGKLLDLLSPEAASWMDCLANEDFDLL
jgi:hypothetical protein